MVYYNLRKTIMLNTARTPLELQLLRGSFFAFIDGIISAVVAYLSLSSHLRTKCRMTPAITASATAIKKLTIILSTALTSFPFFNENSVGDLCIISHTFIFNKALQ